MLETKVELQSDANPQETTEWLESLDSVLEDGGSERATFLLARSTLGAALRSRIKPGGLVAAMEAAVSQHAFTYMLTLRMAPIFPFGVVNVVAGLVKMPLSIFCAATFLGLVPPALVYTSLGVGLAQVFERGEHVDMHTFAKPAIVGPLLALAALSLVPHLIRAWRAKSSPPKP